MPTKQNRLSLADLLLIAEAVLAVPAEELHRLVPLGTAEAALAAPFATVGGTALYPDPVERAAICCSRIARARPFPEGNSQVGYECMLEMLARAGCDWPRLDAAAVALIVERLARHEVFEAEFVRWVRLRAGAS
jgi:prophage maintenance system killer protein